MFLAYSTLQKMRYRMITFFFLISLFSGSRGQGPIHSHGPACHTPPQLGLHVLDIAVHGYFAHTLAPSTTATYRSISNCCLEFCARFSVQPLPLDQVSVTRFVAHPSLSGVAFQSIRIYLSGLRFFQDASDLSDPCLSSIPVLEYMYVLWDVCRLPQAVQKQQRLPIISKIYNCCGKPGPRCPYKTNMILPCSGLLAVLGS